jgi:protein gp37
MSDQTNIEWADSTFNPWIGCTAVSPACDHCYAENLMDKRLHVVNWGAGQPRKRTSAANWRQPEKWNAAPFYQCITCGWRGDKPETKGSIFDGLHSCPECDSLNITIASRRVFCASLADVFDNEVDPQWRIDLFNLIEATPNLDWLLLTKRIGNVTRMVANLPKNVWLGATICNQEEADRDIPKLIAISATVRFLSIEPLLGKIELSAGLVPCPNAANTIMDPATGAHECCKECDYTGTTGEFGIDWIIVGGESGPGARPMHPAWITSLRDQCLFLGVPFLFKQWGEFKPVGRKELNVFGTPSQGYIHPTMKYGELPYTERGGIPSDDELEASGCAYVAKVGKKAAGRLLDGITHTEFPEVGV